MSVLSDVQLLSEAEGTDFAMVNPASVDLRLGHRIIEQTYTLPLWLRLLSILSPSSRYVALAERKYGRTVTRTVHLAFGDSYTFLPGRFYLAHSIETLQIPRNTVVNLFLKSTLARESLNHAMAGVGDPGFEGQMVFELSCHLPVTRKIGDPIVQLVYHRLETEPSQDYGQTKKSHYQGQRGPRRSYNQRGG